MVRSIIRLWLLATGCVLAVGQTPPANWKLPSGQPIFVADERVELETPGAIATAGDPMRVYLRLHSSGLARVSTQQIQYFHGDRRFPGSVRGSERQADILRDSHGSYISVIPLQPGRVELEISGVFDDGGMFHKRISFDATLPLESPQRLLVAQSGLPTRSATVIEMWLNPPGHATALLTNALYDKIPAPVPLDPSSVSYQILNDRDSPVSIDEKTGRLTAVLAGKTLIRILFRNQSFLTCVVVEEHLKFTGSHAIDCQKMLPTGQHLGFSSSTR